MWAMLAAVCAPLCMGSDSCEWVAVPNHAYINTAAVPGAFDVPTDRHYADEMCFSDPFGGLLYIREVIESQLAFRIGAWDTAPASVSGTAPSGPASAAFHAANGWYLAGQYLPTDLVLDVAQSGAGMPTFRGLWYTTHGEWQPNPAACATGSPQRCDFLHIEPHLFLPAFTHHAGHYDVRVGWRIPATGAKCVTWWKDIPLTCRYGAWSTWPYCYLPPNADQPVPEAP